MYLISNTDFPMIENRYPAGSSIYGYPTIFRVSIKQNPVLMFQHIDEYSNPQGFFIDYEGILRKTDYNFNNNPFLRSL